jgi:hypothetical protein
LGSLKVLKNSDKKNMKETQRRRISVTSSLSEKSTGPAGKKGGDEGWGAQGADPLHLSSTFNEDR